MIVVEGDRAGQASQTSRAHVSELVGWLACASWGKGRRKVIRRTLALVLLSQNEVNFGRELARIPGGLQSSSSSKGFFARKSLSQWEF